MQPSLGYVIHMGQQDTSCQSICGYFSKCFMNLKNISAPPATVTLLFVIVKAEIAVIQSTFHHCEQNTVSNTEGLQSWSDGFLIKLTYHIPVLLKVKKDIQTPGSKPKSTKEKLTKDRNSGAILTCQVTQNYLKRNPMIFLLTRE